MCCQNNTPQLVWGSVNLGPLSSFAHLTASLLSHRAFCACLPVGRQIERESGIERDKQRDRESKLLDNVSMPCTRLFLFDENKEIEEENKEIEAKEPTEYNEKDKEKEEGKQTKRYHQT